MKCKLSDVCEYRKGKVHVSNLTLKTYISTENMLPNKAGVVEANSLPSTTLVQEYKENDTLVSNIRPYFKKVWQAKHDGGCSNDVLVFQGKANIDKDFLYYILANDDFFAYSMATSKGTKMPRGDKKSIMQYELQLFDIKIQKRIASILKLFDKKIELNNAINNNLQEQMEALHRSWFIDYAPFGDTKPSNWIKADIYSIANIIYGAPFASKLFNTEGLGNPIIRIRDLKEQTFVTYTTEIHPKGHLIQPGDIVVGMDGEFRPYIWGNSEAWLNQRVCIFESKLPSDKAFMLYTIKPLLNVIEQTQVATTVIHIGKKDYDAFEIVLPDRKTLDQFGEITTPMLERIVNNSIENKKLVQLRDALLPQLMSGELDVSKIKN